MDLSGTGFATRTTNTSTDGLYSFSGVPAGSTNTVTPSKDQFTFNPSSQDITLTGDATAVNFSASPILPLLQFNNPHYVVGEGDGSVQITVERTGQAAVPVSVGYTTADIGASEKSDYTTAIGTLRFAAGETSKSFTVLITDDRFAEGD